MVRFLPLILVLFMLTACQMLPPVGPVDVDASPQLTEARFDGLEGWATSDHTKALAAFRVSCQSLLRREAEATLTPRYLGQSVARWQQVCKAAPQGEVDALTARRFFETQFTPYSVNQGQDGLFTGYYVPLLKASRSKGGIYNTPLHKRPPEVVDADLGAFREDWRGRTLSGRVEGRRLVPYYTRAQIVKGALAGRDLELLWAADPIDAFFLEIQGSGVAELPNGQRLLIGYDGKNGRPYTAIGAEVAHRAGIERSEVTMPSIRSWLNANPAQMQEVMNMNESYVFFRELDKSGAVGASGVVLTPKASLAVDPRHWPYGMPVWLDAEHPAAADKEVRLQSLYIAQDTGGAIRGAVRGDVYWGEGHEAAWLAGNMKSRGEMWVLLPK